MALLHDLRMLLGLRPAVWVDLLRALLELALARRRLGSHPAKALLLQARAFAQPTQATPSNAEQLAARVAFAIPRVAARLPWRSDCFIQAMAAQRWLQRQGIASSLSIGTRKDNDGTFQAHAWLTCGELSITGGDVSGYVPLVTENTPL
jgi:hypothetical protein